MNSKLLTISEASKMLGVSIQTLRRWDNENKFDSIRKKTTGHRYYSKDAIDEYMKNHMKDLFKIARNWVICDSGNEPLPDFYCQNSFVFQSRLSRLESELGKIKGLEKTFPLISAISGEIGNNSFDHNLGNWNDIPGLFFAYDLKKKNVVLADRGQGILATLKKVRPGLANHKDALRVAFTEIISGRAPESRGNGLKFVKNVVSSNKISLLFQTGDANLEIEQNNSELNIKNSDVNFHGCLALIKF
ncbi:MAG: MerR family DNA-binding transcriptional regulator [bacterium]